MFQASTYISRRNLLKSRLGHGVVLLPGNGESGMNTRLNCYPFRQDSTFLYYIGIDRPALAAVIDVDSGNDLLFGDDRTLDETVWTGPQPSLAELASAAGMTQVQPASALAGYIAQAMAAGRDVFCAPP